MKKKKRVELYSRQQAVIDPLNLEVEHERGVVKDNALKAVVTSKLFTVRVVKAKKGKGSFVRKAKHSGKEPYSKVA